MKTLTWSRLLTAFVLVFALASGLAPTAKATFLGEGGSVAPADANGFAAGTLLVSMSDTYSHPSFTGTLYTDVYDNGGLDFWYRIVADPGSAHPLSRLTVTGFMLFLTDVFDRTDMGGGTQRVSNLVDRSSGVIGFNFGTTEPDKINPGETTAWMVVRTNATHFVGTESFVINGGVAVAETLSPAEVPELASFALIGTGLMLLGIIGRDGTESSQSRG